MASSDSTGRNSTVNDLSNPDVDKIGQQILEEQDLYATGGYGSVSNYHLFEDCYHIRGNARPATINAIRFHELTLCDNCRDYFFSAFTTRERGPAPRNSRKINLPQREMDVLEAFVETGVLKDKATTVRTSMYELTVLLDNGHPVDRFISSEIRHRNGGICRDGQAKIYAELHDEDIEMTRRLIDSDEFAFETSTEVYRTAIILYLNTLSEMDLEAYLSGITTEADSKAVEKVIAFDGFRNVDGHKPLGSLKRLKQLASNSQLPKERGES